MEASCALVQVQTQPLIAWLAIDGKAGPRAAIRECNRAVVIGAPFQTAPVHVDHTVRVGSDQRDLGLAVRTIEVCTSDQSLGRGMPLWLRAQHRERDNGEQNQVIPWTHYNRHPWLDESIQRA